MRKPDYARRVVVTGLGVVSPLGNDKDTVWTNLVEGRSGIGLITHFDTTPYEHKAGGEVRDFDITKYWNFKDARRTETTVHFAVAAARTLSREKTPASRMPGTWGSAATNWLVMVLVPIVARRITGPQCRVRGACGPWGCSPAR